MVQSHSNLEGQMEVMKAHPMQVAGSRLPDCTHACGSCTPCRLVMVSFVCSSLTGAETCPISYR
ncbi:protein EPIDERMAL PATTERNING FACTOR 1-like, partial [Fagus crenata]